MGSFRHGHCGILKMSCKYFSVPAPRAANGGQDQHQADAALWQGGRILKKLEPF